jgi:hypothetical protein
MQQNSFTAVVSAIPLKHPLYLMGVMGVLMVKLSVKDCRKLQLMNYIFS